MHIKQVTLPYVSLIIDILHACVVHLMQNPLNGCVGIGSEDFESENPRWQARRARPLNIECPVTTDMSKKSKDRLRDPVL